MTWREEQHPRGGEGTKEGGRFVPKGHAGTPTESRATDVKLTVGERIRSLATKMDRKIEEARESDDPIRHAKLLRMRKKLPAHEMQAEKSELLSQPSAPSPRSRVVKVYRGTGRPYAPTSRDVIPINWFTTDARYAEEYGPNVSASEIELESPLDLRNVTEFENGYEKRETVSRWVEILNASGISVSLLDEDWGNVDVPLWDLLRGAENVGVESATDFGSALARGHWDSIMWYERRSDGVRATAIGSLKPTRGD